MRKIALFLFLLPALAAQAQWNPDNGDGTYSNPIIYADYSDPDVIRVGDDYWMVASSFNVMPGIPLLHSCDLVNWEIAGHVYDRLPLQKYDHPVHGQGSWAPSIRYREGLFYVYFCTPNDGLFVARAADPRGEWDVRQIVDVEKWEDPCPFWDEDGQAYLVHSIHRGGPAIVHRMSPDGLRLLDNGTVVYHNIEENPVLEGLKMMKRNGWYYIFAPAGGVETGWQTVLRSRDIYGPYESRRVLEPGNGINGPHQGGLVETQTGEWWFIHFQSKGVYGRIDHLQPARWTVDDWIVIGGDPDGDGTGIPVLTHRKPDVGGVFPVRVPQTSDEFDAPTLGLQWQWQAHEDPRWFSTDARAGGLRLFAEPCPSEQGNLYYAGNLLLQKLPAPEFTAETAVEARFTAIGERAGAIVMGNAYTYIALIRGETGNRIAVVGGRNDRLAVVPVEEASVPTRSDRVWFRVHIYADAECGFSYSTDGANYTALGGRYPVVPGTWIGAKTGIFCSSPNIVPGEGYSRVVFMRIFNTLSHIESRLQIRVRNGFYERVSPSLFFNYKDTPVLLTLKS